MRSFIQASGLALTSAGKTTNHMDGAFIPMAPALTVSDSANQLQCPPSLMEDEAKVIINPNEDIDFFFSHHQTPAHTSLVDDLDTVGTNKSVHTLKTSVMKKQCGCGCHTEIRVTGFMLFTCNCDVEYITDINEYWSLKDIVANQFTGSITDYGLRMKCKHQVIRTRYIHRRGFCRCNTLSGNNGEATNSDDVVSKPPAKEIKIAYGCQKGCSVPFHYHKVTKQTKENVTPAAKAFYEREKKRTGGKEEGAFYLCEYYTADCKRVQDGQIHYHAPTKSKEHVDPIQESMDNSVQEELGKADGVKEFLESNDKVVEKPSKPVFLPRVIELKQKKDARIQKQKEQHQPQSAKTVVGKEIKDDKVELSTCTTTAVDVPNSLPMIAEPKVAKPLCEKIILTNDIIDTMRLLYDNGTEEKSLREVPNKRQLCNNNNFVEGQVEEEKSDETVKEESVVMVHDLTNVNKDNTPPANNESDSTTDGKIVPKNVNSMLESVNTLMTSNAGKGDGEDSVVMGLNLGPHDEKFTTPIFTNKDKKALRKTMYESIGNWVRKKFYPIKKEYDGLFQIAMFEERLDINQVVNEYKGWFLRTFERDWTDPNYVCSTEVTRASQIDTESLLSMGYNGYYYGEVYHELAAWLLIKSALDSTGPVASGEVYNYLVNTVANKMHTLADDIRGFYFCPRNHATTQNTIMHVTNIKVAMCCKNALALPKRTNKGVPGLVYNAKDFL